MSSIQDICYKCGALNPSADHVLCCDSEFIECCGKLWKKNGIAAHRKGKKCNYNKKIEAKVGEVIESCTLCGFSPKTNLKSLEHNFNFHRKELNFKHKDYITQRKQFINQKEKINNGKFAGAYTSGDCAEQNLIIWNKNLNLQDSVIIHESQTLNKFDTNNNCINSVITGGVEIMAEKNLIPRCVFVCREAYIGDFESRSIALIIENYEFVEEIILTYGDLGPVGSDLISKALLKNTTLKKLSISDCRIGQNNTELISTVLMYNYTLESLILGRNRIEDYGALCISGGLAVNQSLRYLDISENRIEDTGISYIENALRESRSLTGLNISGNQISLVGCMHIASLIKNNSSLLSLGLNCLSIRDEGIFIISLPLAENTTLTKIGLNGNFITDGEIISYVIRTNNTLVELDIGYNCLMSMSTDSIELALEDNTSLTKLNIEHQREEEYVYISHYDLMLNKNISKNNQSLLSLCMREYI